MVGYYRGCCHNFANVVAPLTDLLSPKRPFEWSQQCQCAFDNAKSLLANAPVLRAPNFERPFLLAVDASAYGAGAVLLQENVKGIQHAVSYLKKIIKSSSACIFYGGKIGFSPGLSHSKF